MPPPRPVIEYYFSFLSLWTYMGSQRLRELAKQHDAQIAYKPIDLMRLFSVSGGVAVRQRPIQRQAYRLLEMERWRRLRGLPVVRHPRFYPADPSLAHRVLLAAVEEQQQQQQQDSEAVHDFALRGSAAVWAREMDIGDDATVVALADEAGLDGRHLVDRAKKDAILGSREAALTEEVISKKFFGAPVYVYKDEPFWGQDRLEMLDDVIKSGRGPILLPTEGILN
jgi:2-hydroxychromene-2-carboxylate isomerase